MGGGRQERSAKGVRFPCGSQRFENGGDEHDDDDVDPEAGCKVPDIDANAEPLTVGDDVGRAQMTALNKAATTPIKAPATTLTVTTNKT